MNKQEVEAIQAAWKERNKGTTLSDGDPRLNEPRLCEALLEAMEALKPFARAVQSQKEAEQVIEVGTIPKVWDFVSENNLDCASELVRQFYGEEKMNDR